MATSTAKALLLSGPNASFVLTPVSAPGCAAGHLLVRNRAVGVNFIDIYHRTGLYPLATWPAVLGREAAGVVVAVGKYLTIHFSSFDYFTAAISHGLSTPMFVVVF